jgi:hypothetical protein
MPAPFDDTPLTPRRRYQASSVPIVPELDLSRSKERRAMYSSQQMSRLSASLTYKTDAALRLSLDKSQIKQSSKRLDRIGMAVATSLTRVRAERTPTLRRAMCSFP